MKQWQQAIYNAVKPGILEMARSLKKSYPQAGVSLNFNLQWPQGFRAGENTNIPITLPSKHGSLQVGNAVVGVDYNNKIIGVGVEATKGDITVYDPSVGPPNIETITGTMDRFSDFLGDINNVLSSNAMQALLMPRVSGISSGLSFPAGGIVRAGGTPGLQTLGYGINAPVAGKPRAWNQVKGSTLAAEQARAQTITTPDAQAEFLEQALGSPSKAPHWYTALGGQQKEKMKEKLKKTYLEQCKSMKRTIPPSIFFQKVSELMLHRANIAYYCEKDSDFVDGNFNGQCEQRTCPVYDPNCKKLSTRLNITS
jgi:hypothetical protein